MAGESGTGKSTLARAIGRRTGAVVLDKDWIKAALLDEGLEEAVANGAAYAVLFELAHRQLENGHSVIIDSPAAFPSIPVRGHDAAAEFDSDYYLIECHCSDASVHDRRLRTRDRRDFQPATLSQVIEQRSRPNVLAIQEPHLLVDTAQPLEVCLEKALEYLGR
jgi:predicted kinase